jgi:hypothetical protein
MVAAAEAELEADIATIGVYANLSNVYRMTDTLISSTHRFLDY